MHMENHCNRSSRCLTFTSSDITFSIAINGEVEDILVSSLFPYHSSVSFFAHLRVMNYKRQTQAVVVFINWIRNTMKEKEHSANTFQIHYVKRGKLAFSTSLYGTILSEILLSVINQVTSLY